MAKGIKAAQSTKKKQLETALLNVSQTKGTGFERLMFVHNALPELNFDEIDTTVRFLGQKVNYPFLISCMTGGFSLGAKVIQNLAIVAEKHRIAMGVGSQKIAIENPSLKKFFNIRKIAKSVPLIANAGLIQLNYGFRASDYQKIVDMIQADALAIHLNSMQEAIQAGGDRRWKGLLRKLEVLRKKISVPVIVKEVGLGISREVAERLINVGIRYIDTAGYGGTNWVVVGGIDSKQGRDLSSLFSKWGIPTVESIKMCVQAVKTSHKKVVIIGSGGIRSGLDVAKSIALGSDLAGIGIPFARAAIKSADQAERLIKKTALELKISMFGVGARNIKMLKNSRMIEFGIE
jgi:isopentenyl-diphosphate delta-isomerase